MRPRPVLAVGTVATLVPAVLAYAGHERLSLALLVIVSPLALACWMRVAHPALSAGTTTGVVALLLAASLLVVFLEYRFFDRTDRVDISQVLGLTTAGAVGLIASGLGRVAGTWILERRRRARLVSDPCEECPSCGTCYEPGTARCPEDGARLLASAVPQLLAGRYRLARRLGRGGMGTVYAAHDTSLDRQVAVKVLRSDALDFAGATNRFQQEARAAASFTHPNVVTVHDYGVSGAQVYLVMEVAGGRTLRDLLRSREPVEPARVVSLLRDVAAAMEAAHRRQLIHRDLKPENVSLVQHGAGETAKVLDFGLATLMADADDGPLAGRLADGTAAGTPLYMAPEQLRGEPAAPSWDVWALAIIAFEMLSGTHPFASTTFADDRLSGETLGGSLQHLPVSTRMFFERALAVDRARRPPSAASFIADLERSLHG